MITRLPIVPKKKILYNLAAYNFLPHFYSVYESTGDIYELPKQGYIYNQFWPNEYS